VPERETVCALEANTPHRLTKQFVALTPTELGQEIFKVIRRRLFGEGDGPGVPVSPYTIDLTTGKTTLVGSRSYWDLRRIAFLNEPPRVRFPIRRLTWLWLILVGYILVTPIDPSLLFAQTRLAVSGSDFSALA
jgi:hypothetical protein